jgi:hypothetical protein
MLAGRTPTWTRTPGSAGRPDSDPDSDSGACWPVGLGLDS